MSVIFYIYSLNTLVLFGRSKYHRTVNECVWCPSYYLAHARKWLLKLCICVILRMSLIEQYILSCIYCLIDLRFAAVIVCVLIGFIYLCLSC